MCDYAASELSKVLRPNSTKLAWEAVAAAGRRLVFYWIVPLSLYCKDC